MEGGCRRACLNTQHMKPWSRAAAAEDPTGWDPLHRLSTFHTRRGNMSNIQMVGSERGVNVSSWIILPCVKGAGGVTVQWRLSWMCSWQMKRLQNFYISSSVILNKEQRPGCAAAPQHAFINCLSVAPTPPRRQTHSRRAPPGWLLDQQTHPRPTQTHTGRMNEVFLQTAFSLKSQWWRCRGISVSCRNWSDWSPVGGDDSEDPRGDSRHFHKQMCLCWSLFKASNRFLCSSLQLFQKTEYHIIFKTNYKYFSIFSHKQEEPVRVSLWETTRFILSAI